jgi:hypothetical protein
MKKLIYTIAFVLLPISSYAEDKNHQFHPTVQEVYDDCKAALVFADEDKIEDFLATKCAARIDGLISGITFQLLSNAAAMTDDMDDYDEHEKKFIAKLGNEHKKRFCTLETLDLNKPIEPQIARLYVDTIENYKFHIPFEKFMNTRRPTHISEVIFDRPCDKKR